MKLWQQISLICSVIIVLVAVSCSALQMRITRENVLRMSYEQAAEKQRSLASSFQEMADYYSSDADSGAVKRSLVRYCFSRFSDSTAVLVMDGELWYSQVPVRPQDFFVPKNAVQEQHSAAVSGRELVIVGSALRIAAFPDSVCHVYVVEDISHVYDDLDRLLGQFALIGGLCAAAAVTLIIILVRRAMGPLVKLQQTAAHIAAGDYARRVELSSRDEVGQLARSFDLMAESVETQVKELSETNRRQKLFIGGVSHEFKTPLTGIILSADSLQNTCMSEEEQHDAVERIAAQAKWLERLVQKMLRLLTLEREISPGSVHVPALLERVRESAAATLEKQGVRLETDCRMERMYADADLLQSALVNLVENAARASEPGQSVRLSACDNIFEISDSGRGMEPGTLEHVTEPFYMADKARSKKYGGVGLGLALVKETARAHGAELEIESKIGVGTTVTLRFKGPLSDGSQA